MCVCVTERGRKNEREGRGRQEGEGGETCHSASLPMAVTVMGILASMLAPIALIGTLTGELSSPCHGGSEAGFSV